MLKPRGRPKGSKDKSKRVTAARKLSLAATIAADASQGETPIQYMLRVMNDPNAEKPRRDDMAKAAAPYIHPKQATIEHTGNVTMTHEGALKALE